MSPGTVEIALGAGVPDARVAWDAARRLGQAFVDRGAAWTAVKVNANVRRVLAAQRLEGGIRISVHWQLVGHADDVVAVLGGDHGAPWTRLRALVAPTPTRQPKLEPQGRVYDLVAIRAAQQAHLSTPCDTPITWGRWPATPPRRQVRLGSCTSGPDAVIRVHPVLDHRDVPEWFVGFVVFHELLHVLHPPRDGGGRRAVHHREFQRAEVRHPDYGRAHAWEERHIGSLFARMR